MRHQPGFRTGDNKFKAKLRSVGSQVKTVSGQVKSQVRHSLATLSSSLSSTLASAAATINDGDTAKVVDHLSTVKRRTAQLALQKLGRTEASEDPEYDALMEDLITMKENLNTLADHLAVFLSAVRGACAVVPEIFVTLPFPPPPAAPPGGHSARATTPLYCDAAALHA
jgi:hypothetical protein